MRARARRALVLAAAVLLGGGLGAVGLSWRARTAVIGFVWPDESAELSAGVRRAAAAAAAAGGLCRAPLPEELVRRILPLRGRERVYDPHSWFRAASGIVRWREWPEAPGGGFEVRTNSLGLRMDAEPRAERPDLRVLVAGDSHVAGQCANADGFAARLGTLLAEAVPERSVEVLNGAHGAYSFYQHLGVLERMLALGLAPDLFVVVVYGGNDFLDVWMRHFFAGTRGPASDAARRRRLEGASERHPGALGQALNAAEYFRHGGPDEVAAALAMGREVTAEMQRVCAAAGSDLVVVYLPAPSEVGDRAPQEELRAGAHELELGADDLALVGAMADRYLAALDETGVPHVDLRTAFARSERELYWRADLHLSIAGHDLAALTVAPWVEEWWRERR